MNTALNRDDNVSFDVLRISSGIAAFCGREKSRYMTFPARLRRNLKEDASTTVSPINPRLREVTFVGEYGIA